MVQLYSAIENYVCYNIKNNSMSNRYVACKGALSSKLSMYHEYAVSWKL